MSEADQRLWRAAYKEEMDGMNVNKALVELGFAAIPRGKRTYIFIIGGPPVERARLQSIPVSSGMDITSHKDKRANLCDKNNRFVASSGEGKLISIVRPNRYGCD